VGRLNFKTDEKSLERGFEVFGSIKRVKIVRDSKAKSRGYGFIEFQETRSADIAYNRGDGRKIDGVSVLVDKELARIDKYWVPRRLGGGKGGEKRRNRDEEQYVKTLKKEMREKAEALAEKKPKTEEK
jgi:U1 small nuclear ribonucleoprotein 70kDa